MVWGVGCGVQGLECRIYGVGCRVCAHVALSDIIPTAGLAGLRGRARRAVRPHAPGSDVSGRRLAVGFRV
jgi:hypothetical protein